ncbi:MAG: LytTR family DNA-binding domain-containing protein [Gammaproteobacteria bacterium]|nr:LytTR family DNA-binding domain-containing protein [Gammaproteobacteria bacterium]
MKSIVVADDEPELRRNLVRGIMKHWAELDEIIEAADGVSALKAIETHRPDAVFLDIQMPGMTGIQVAEKLPEDCHLVFVTAYDQYAVKAFEQHAVDFLLKPYTEDRLLETISRLKHLGRPRVSQFELQSLFEQLGKKESTSAPLQWIRAAKGEDISLINVNDIVYFQAGDKYTTVKTAQSAYLIRLSLKELEQQLDTQQFWRIHRGIILNVHFVENARRTIDGSYKIQLRGCKDTLKSSRAYSHLFRQM